jgi:hypothetical protein
MPVLKVELDSDSLQLLTELALSERRPVAWQAEVILLQALNRWPARRGTTTGALAKVEEAHVQ